MIRLNEICRRWRAESILYCLLVAFAAAVVLTTAAHRWMGWPLWLGVVVWGGCFGIALLVFPIWRLRVSDVASYLDRRLPELEESCGLLLRSDAELGLLERWQAGRVEKRLAAAVLPRPLRGRLFWGLGFVGMAFLASVVIGWIGGRVVTAGTSMVSAPVKREIVPAGVRSVRVRITPPAYTGRALREQENFSMEVEEGAQVNWEIATTGAVDTVAFIFNDTAMRVLRREDGGRWSLSVAAIRSGFYQVKIGGQLSGLYRLEVVKDESPKVKIVRPKSYTLIEYGEPTRIPLQVELTDDYGIVGSSVFATVSSGKGEAVKFKQQELHWDRGFSGGTRYDLSRVIDLPALGLKPGDELYFYCTATDNHGQQSRSDMYILSLADTAQLMSLEGITLPTNIKPEFFRSERQIIIETEQLLKEKDTIAVQVFKDKSNDLGIDQKLLRLRYGKFLGEEAEEGERGGASGDTTSFGAFGDDKKILEAYSDKHDNAEDATFLEPAIKAQLKATLSEMWKAELQLRVYKPQEALPFCYKALRLLKDLQQQSRAYVAKTGVKLTPLNPAKRLTGELGTIAAPVERARRADGLPEEDVLRMGLAVLEGMRDGLQPGGDSLRRGEVIVRPGEGGLAVLRQVERRLAGEAAARPGKFLEGYEGMRRLMEGGGRGVAGGGTGDARDRAAASGAKGIEGGVSARSGVSAASAASGGSTVADVIAAEKAIGELLPAAEALPGVRREAADGGLSGLYFRAIK